MPGFKSHFTIFELYDFGTCYLSFLSLSFLSWNMEFIQIDADKNWALSICKVLYSWTLSVFTTTLCGGTIIISILHISKLRSRGVKVSRDYWDSWKLYRWLGAQQRKHPKGNFSSSQEEFLVKFVCLYLYAFNNIWKQYRLFLPLYTSTWLSGLSFFENLAETNHLVL